MRVLLDECVPRKLRGELPGHHVKTVAEMGWSGTKNGALLALAVVEFDVMLTVDQGLPFQQDVSKLDLAIIILKARSNDIQDLQPMMRDVRRSLESVRPGQVVEVGPNSPEQR